MGYGQEFLSYGDGRVITVQGKLHDWVDRQTAQIDKAFAPLHRTIHVCKC